MRRDVCYYFETDSKTLYDTYLTAAKNPPFGRTCDEKPYHTFSFGLNYSFKYNMNGGACTLRFIPMKTGAAVNLRFSIAQLAGARYESYADYLTEHAEKILHLRAQRCNINVDEFMKADSLVFSSSAAPSPVTAQPTAQLQAAPAASCEQYCSACGNKVPAGDAFCKFCGAPLAKAPQFCSHCGAKADQGAAFCTQCGQKL